MADFDKVVSKGVLEVKPSRDGIYDIVVSEDTFDFFDGDEILNIPIRVKVLDQGRVSSNEDVRRRANLIKSLNKHLLLASTFVLSSDSLPYYNELMAQCNWKNKKRTALYMPVEYDPLTVKDLKVEWCQGTLMVSEKTLLWMKNMYLARGHVNEDVFQDAEFFKRFIPELMQRIYDKYDFDKLDQFDKTFIITNLVNRSISYAEEAVEYVNGKCVLKKDAPSFVSKPLGTLKNKRGVCSGFTRLQEILLNNPYMMVNASSISGELGLNSHMWLGVEINDKCYQADRGVGAFKDLDSMGYFPNKGQVITEVYEHDYLLKPEVVEESVKRHMKK